MAEKSTASNLLAYVEKQLKRFSTNLEKAVESGDVEAIHDLRVASRRLREPLRILAPWSGQRKIEGIVRCLSKARRAFRKVRDLDVVQASVCGASSPLPLDTTDLAQLEGMLTRRRARALRKAGRKARRSEADRAARAALSLLDELGESVSDCEEIETQVRNAGEELVSRWTERLSGKDPRSPQTAHLHETRLCVKRLRYAAELRSDLEGGERDPMISALADSQELLGQWNDHLIASSHITAIARKARTLAQQPGWSANLLRYAASRAQEAENLRRRIVDSWGKLDQIFEGRQGLPTTKPQDGQKLAEAPI